MTPQRRTALVSVIAAAVLIVAKLVTGLVTGSLGFVSEAAHSGTDLVAALLTLFAVGVAVRPADRGHTYGHGKAEHLSALAEAAILALVSVFIVWRAVDRLAGGEHPDVDATWWAFVILAAVIVIDASRTGVSLRAARRYGSAALEANALHFASDLAGSLALVAGLILVAVGFDAADSVAALFVAVLVLVAAGRLIRRNVDVLMDRAPAEAQAAARRAIQAIEPSVELRRLRLRQAAGRHFADVVIGVQPGAVVAQGHDVADAVEEAIQRVLPGADVVVHVEPRLGGDAALGERALAAALRIPPVREVHNVNVRRVGSRTEVSLHLKLPGELSLDAAHAIASRVEAAIAEALPEIDAVQTHLEPLAEPSAATAPRLAEVGPELERVRQIVRDVTGDDARELRLLRTDDGFVILLTLRVDPASPLAEAHARASDVEARIRKAQPEVADVIVHTEP